MTKTDIKKKHCIRYSFFVCYIYALYIRINVHDFVHCTESLLHYQLVKGLME